MTVERYAIETQDLTRRFGTRTVVDRLHLRVRAAGIYGFLGLNGAGKTTTIRLLLGLIKPDTGSIQLFGRPFEHRHLGRIGALVDMPSLYSHLTGRENLEVTRRQLGAPRACIDRALEIVRLVSDAGRVVAEYSMGMRQRLGLAMALLHSPDLLILDEPTNGLDPAGIHEIRDLIRRMPVEHGVTVFLSSHLLSEVEQIAGSVAILHEGHMTFEGSLAELRARGQTRLRVGAEAPAQAAALLQASGFEASLDERRIISVRGHELDAGRINRLLSENGHGVFHLSLDRDSLEEIFLSMTGGGVSC